MNYGKICVSVSAKSTAALLEAFARAEPFADVIELRLDHLEPAELGQALSSLPASRPVLLTFRSRSQGGLAPDDQAERTSFWETTLNRINPDNIWIDTEFDISDDVALPDEITAIRSFHDFHGCPENIEAIFDGLAGRGIAKIAVTASSITDCLPLWRVLTRAPAAGQRLVPIAMGEAGKWTRILGLAHGALMTYAALDAGAETAPGQITAADLRDVYRVKELDLETEVYGIVAGNTSYSVSPWMHNAAFKAAKMNRVFVPLQVDDLSAFITKMVRLETREAELNFRGLSVTNPHKQAIIPHLDTIDETAKAIGAVNTVKIEAGRLIGFNTDAPGFIAPLKKMFGDLKNARVAVVGAGGASRACTYALAAEGADVTVTARDRKKGEAVASAFNASAKCFDETAAIGEFDILVNTTPLGTAGDQEEMSIATADRLAGVKLVYDLVYNPMQTMLIREAKAAGVASIGGLEMLIAQGVGQFEIWTGKNAPADEMAAAVKRKLGL